MSLEVRVQTRVVVVEMGVCEHGQVVVHALEVLGRRILVLQVPKELRDVDVAAVGRHLVHARCGKRARSPMFTLDV